VEKTQHMRWYTAGQRLNGGKSSLGDKAALCRVQVQVGALAHLMPSLPHFSLHRGLHGAGGSCDLEHNKCGRINGLHRLATPRAKVCTNDWGHGNARRTVRIFLQDDAHMSDTRWLALKIHFNSAVPCTQCRKIDSRGALFLEQGICVIINTHKPKSGRSCDMSKNQPAEGFDVLEVHLHKQRLASEQLAV